MKRSTLFLSLILSLCWTPLGAQDVEPRTHTIELASGEVELTVDTTYDFILTRGRTLRGAFLRANDTQVKIAVSRGSGGQLDALYLRISEIKEIVAKVAISVPTREVPDEVADPYDAIRKDLEAKKAAEEEEAARAAAEAEGREEEVVPEPVAPVPAESFGEIDPEVATKADALLARIQVIDTSVLDAATAASLENTNVVATEGLKKLGPAVTPVLADRLPGTNDRQLRAAVTVLIDLFERRAVPLILSEYDRRRKTPSLPVLQAMAQSGIPELQTWLVGVAGDNSRPADERRVVLLAIQDATPSPELAASLRSLAETTTAPIEVRRTAVSAFRRLSPDPATGLIEMLEAGTEGILPNLAQELATLEAPGLEARLLTVAEANTSTGVRGAVTRVFLQRANSRTSLTTLRWILDQLENTSDEDLLREGLESLQRLQLPGRDQGLDYELVVITGLDPARSGGTLRTAQTCVDTLGAEASDEVCEALAETWRDLLDLDAASQAPYRAFLDGMGRTTRLLSRRTLATPDELEAWIESR